MSQQYAGRKCLPLAGLLAVLALAPAALAADGPALEPVQTIVLKGNAATLGKLLGAAGAGALDDGSPTS